MRRRVRAGEIREAGSDLRATAPRPRRDLLLPGTPQRAIVFPLTVLPPIVVSGDYTGVALCLVRMTGLCFPHVQPGPNTMDIGQWLRSLGLERYASLFREHEITEDVLPSLTSDDLRELGVVPIGLRRMLLTAIADLRAAPPAPVAPTLSAECRQITCMFCDLVGSSALANRLDLELLRELINDYYTTVARIVPRFEGFVARYTGDGALVYFGYPQAHEDAARFAVRAGLALVAAIAGLPFPEPLHARVGIATGLVVVGALAGSGSEHEIVGEAPNLAARLQALADPDGVMISETTRRLIGSSFVLDPVGSIQLKGWEAPVSIWRVIAENPSAARFDTAHSALPLVGRAAELQQLSAAWEEVVGGRSRVVVLTGEAGIGKSRMVSQFSAQVTGTGHHQLAFQCSPSHAQTALHPVLRQIEAAAGFRQGETAERRREQLRMLLLQSADISSDELAIVAGLMALPAAVGHPGMASEALERKTRIFAILLKYLSGMAERGPLLLLLEDAHWIDPTTLQLFERFIDQISNQRALLIVTARPEFVPLVDTGTRVTRITLSRLGSDASVAIIRQVAGGRDLPARVIEEILFKTDGIPLFIEELTKSILESDLLVAGVDHWQLRDPLGSEQNPQHVAQLVDGAT